MSPIPEWRLADDWFDSEPGKAQIASFPRRRLQSIESLDEPVIYFCSDAAAHTTGNAASAITRGKPTIPTSGCK